MNEESLLVQCIREVSLGINKTFSLFPTSTTGLFTHPVVAVDKDKDKNKDIETTEVPIREIILFTNFMSQHRYVCICI